MSQKLDIKLVFALFSIALFWGTTYLAMRIGVETIPPILVTGLRNLIAGGILFIYLKSNKQLESMTLSRIKQNIIISFQASSPRKRPTPSTACAAASPRTASPHGYSSSADDIHIMK